jgi:tRNA(Ser,Leu) C12 N-acetylase TAN1
MDPDANLLVSTSWKAPGRARREIVMRLRRLGDDAPVVSQTDRRGVMTVRTALDPRQAIRRLRDVHHDAPGAFRYTFKWVPVDLWSPTDRESLRQAVAGLRDRIAPGERWRITVERRSPGSPPVPEVIATVVDLVDRKVDLTHPDKILLIELFERHAALAVVTAAEIFTPAAGPPPSATDPASQRVADGHRKSQ